MEHAIEAILAQTELSAIHINSNVGHFISKGQVAAIRAALTKKNTHGDIAFSDLTLSESASFLRAEIVRLREDLTRATPEKRPTIQIEIGKRERSLTQVNKILSP